MKSSKLLTFLSALAFSSAASAVTTDAVGFVSVTVPANSDAILAVPLNRAAEFKGVIQTIAGNVITVAGTPAWTANAFAPGVTANKTYAVQIASGAKEGLIGKITANTNNTVTITLDSGEDTTGIGSVDVPVDPDAGGPLLAQADQIDLFPYWTPSSLISAASVTPNSQILLLASTQAGVNLSSSGALLFDAGSWYDDNFVVADHLALPFGTAFIYRNGTSSTTISMVGSVPMSRHRTILRTRAANVNQDIAIGFSSPVPTPIGSLGLGFAEDDQVLIYNNAAAGINKSSTGALIYTTADGWVNDNFEPVGTTFMLQPGQGYIFRKKGTPTAQSIVWTALQTYLQ